MAVLLLICVVMKINILYLLYLSDFVRGILVLIGLGIPIALWIVYQQKQPSESWQGITALGANLILLAIIYFIVYDLSLELINWATW